MNKKSRYYIKLLLIILSFFVFFLGIVSANSIVIKEYFKSKKISLPNGEILEKHIINGPPRPPEGVLRTKVSLAQIEQQGNTHIIDDVPAFTWCFGCSATSASMIASYYDRNGFPNMYTGPTNNGVMPLNNDEYWTIWTDSCDQTRNRAPASATQQGLDQRTGRGHVDDYWVCYGNSSDDPFVSNGWDEHTHGECTADFMGTSQSSYPMENGDGATSFWNYGNGDKLTADMLFDAGPDYYKSSGLCGIQEFYESRGYAVENAYNQLIYPYESNDHGFTYEQYKSEIDANRPVMIHVEGHTMVGVGYEDSSQLMYIHDTWDHSIHSMSWSGIYSGMQHYAVTVVTLQSSSCIFDISPSSGSFGSGGGSQEVIIDTSSSDCSWSVSEGLSWVSVTPTCGNGDDSVMIFVEENPGESRSGSVSIAGKIFSVNQDHNHPPEIASAPSGPSSGEIATFYTFSVSGSDQDSDILEFRFDWNESISAWGSSEQSHSWDSPGTYGIMAQARDEHGATSNWSSEFTIDVNVQEPFVLPWLYLLLEE